ncbi:hypothetical protein [Thalassotalea sp. ND16A]|uniref:hypothetical protein n=1 Tax=Thalassotalea sp. ND16A TaxID=1535422 RepID=UPI00051A8B44|nr:hypothetical protein [Thalassotalea sp. ND16A]KGK00505.1 hypothetical protein ND16A_3473 [Thalassotalea sp. ND16A]
MQQTLSTAALLKSTIIALIIAVLALVSFILPAEYNVDPTGVGAKLGLTALANTNEKTAAKPNEKTDTRQASDTIEVIVPAGRGVEFKFSMQQFEKMEYQWQTDGEPLYFDLHGEPAGDTTGYFESYAIATLTQMKGSFTAPFAGSHGWYWKNKSDKAVAVQLMAKGEYAIIGLKK